MTESSGNTERNRFILTSLAIMLIFILTLLVLLAAYPVFLAPPPTITPTITRTPTITQTRTSTPTVTLTPTRTRTPRQTFTLTFTLTPSLTPRPSQTPTPAGPPTLTPARPVLGGDIYTLLPWSPEEADRVIALINDYPNTLPRQARGENDENYYNAFSYAVLAQNEALLRFPDAPQAEGWRWGLAYNLARTGSPKAGQHYADLFTAGLNQGATSLDNLEEWFTGKEPRLEFEIIEIEPLPGYLSSHLVRVGGAGSSVILLLETPSAYQAIALTSEFDFVNPVESQMLVSDLTGDGIQEAIIYSLLPEESLSLTAPRVFDLSKFPYQELPFNPATAGYPIGTEYTTGWSAVEDTSGKSSLKFETALFPICPVNFSRTYTWDGERFEASSPEFRINPQPGLPAFCDPVVTHAFRNWGAGIAAQLMEPLLPDWPPEVDEQGKPYPPDAKDEWRYRLGIYYALSGNFEKATEYLQGIVSDPAIPSSSWVQPAQAFLDAYQAPGDLYRACSTSLQCDPRQAITHLARTLPAENPSSLLTALREAGMSQVSTGYYDFDGDGSTESWFTVRHRPGEKIELWILAAYPDGVRPIFVDTIEAEAPEFIPYVEGETPPVLILEGRTAFQIDREPGSLIPYIRYPKLPQFYPNRYEEALEPVIDDLFQGADPAGIYKRLVSIEDNPGLLCVATWTCDRYYYVRGLSAELAGLENLAIEDFLKVWWDHSKSPYTSMVRLRVKGPAILPSLTPLPTGTATATVPATPTVTGTPPTATVSLTPTVSPTNPYPSPTQ